MVSYLWGCEVSVVLATGILEFWRQCQEFDCATTAGVKRCWGLKQSRRAAVRARLEELLNKMSW